MLKLMRFLVVLAFVLTLSGTALAQEPITPQQADPTWHAVYWDNMTLSGRPALERNEVALSHEWGIDSPPGLSPNQFSARWTRYVDLEAGIYRFTATSDDGMRVWVDGELLINEWYDHAANTVEAQKTLEAGLHWIEVEYYENGGFATVDLSWMPVSPDLYNWQASYWNNTTHAGTPAFQRSEREIDHNWGAGSPHASILSDGFSARWTRNIDVSAGVYRFTATSDDGMRVWVDNELIIDQWSEHPARTASAEKQLSAGEHWVVVEYYESEGVAVAKLAWEALSTPVLQWQGEYFDNTTLSGVPDLVRSDADIDFVWGGGSPAPNRIGNDRFSARWTRTLDLPAGRYRFAMTVDDGGRLWVNEHLLIEAWRDQSATIFTGDIHLPGGEVPVRMEYYENGGVAVARLSWSRIGDPTSPGTFVQDDAEAGFVQGGTAGDWNTAPEGYGGQLTWTRNNDRERPDYNWGRWYADLTAGRYEVLVYIPDRYTTTSNARYWVIHADGSTLRTVDQSANGGQWVSLGTYTFDGTQGEYVLLTDITFEAQQSRLVAFDAVKWMPR